MAKAIFRKVYFFVPKFRHGCKDNFDIAVKRQKKEVRYEQSYFNG